MKIIYLGPFRITAFLECVTTWVWDIAGNIFLFPATRWEDFVLSVGAHNVLQVLVFKNWQLLFWFFSEQFDISNMFFFYAFGTGYLYDEVVLIGLHSNRVECKLSVI